MLNGTILIQSWFCSKITSFDFEGKRETYDTGAYFGCHIPVLETLHPVGVNIRDL